MLYKTHVAVTYAATLPLLVSTDSLALGNVIALGLGSVFPDIDNPKSYIGSRSRGISDGIGKLFGHRGMAHSLIGAFIFLVLCRFILSSLHLPMAWSDWFFIGFIAHLIEDSFSRTGVAWLQPIYNKRIQFGFKKIYYSTGGIVETVLFILASAALFFQVYQLI